MKKCPLFHRCHDLRMAHPVWRPISKSATASSAGISTCPRDLSASIRIRRSIFTILARLRARRCSTTTASSSSSTNFWTIEAPPGYSLLFTHPVNRDRPAVHHAHRPRRLRHVPRQPAEFPGALARCRFQRRAAEGHAGGAMPAGKARKLDRPLRDVVRRRHDASDCNQDGAGKRDPACIAGNSARRSASFSSRAEIAPPRSA